jgi:hypothetical protein
MGSRKRGKPGGMVFAIGCPHPKREPSSLHSRRRLFKSITLQYHTDSEVRVRLEDDCLDERELESFARGKQSRGEKHQPKLPVQAINTIS